MIPRHALSIVIRPITSNLPEFEGSRHDTAFESGKNTPGITMYCTFCVNHPLDHSPNPVDVKILPAEQDPLGIRKSTILQT
jgi:hypothetical protein